MIIIGITGNIASGKSTVSKLFKKDLEGAVFIDADDVSREINKPGSATWENLVKFFGKEITNSQNKEISREKIASIVFKDRKKLKKLEQITHPAITRNIKQKISLIQKKAPQTIIILEATKLLDSGLMKMVDFVVVVTTARENQFTRLMTQRDYSMAQALERIEVYQIPKEHEKITFVIENSGTLPELEEKVKAVKQKLLK